MELIALNSDMIPMRVLDTYDSLLWTDRYCGHGDFEFISSDIGGTLGKLIGCQYLGLAESEHVMVLEDVNIITNPPEKDKLKIKGRSLESILDRRVVWSKVNLTGNFQDAVERTLDLNAINPINTNRAITKLIFESSTDPAITDLTIDDQVYGQTLYEIVFNQSISRGIGFKIVLNEQRRFVFSLYSGEDRSYSQFANPFVIFSRSFDNLLSSNYTQSTRLMKTVAIVAGEEGIGNLRKIVEVEPVSTSDLNRREVFVDAQSVTRNVPDEEPLTDEEYEDQLVQKGLEELANRSVVESFDTEIDSTRMYIFGQHFFIGDIVQVADDYGHQKRVQVAEVIHFQDSSGSSINPTFTSLE